MDAGGERTFLTSRGAEATLTPADLARGAAGPRDAVYLSGYGLVHPGNAGRDARLAGPARRATPWCSSTPGRWPATCPADVLDRVLRRGDWLTCNAREAALLTGRADPRPRRGARRRSGRQAAVRRRGGCWCGPARPGAWSAWPGPAAPVHVPGFRVDVVDTNGAGDTHTGTFIAALARGADAVAAARTANAAAALSVTRRGPATAPTEAELAE